MHATTVARVLWVHATAATSVLSAVDRRRCPETFAWPEQSGHYFVHYQCMLGSCIFWQKRTHAKRPQTSPHLAWSHISSNYNIYIINNKYLIHYYSLSPFHPLPIIKYILFFTHTVPVAFGYCRGQSYFTHCLCCYVQILGAISARFTLVIRTLMVTLTKECVSRRTDVT